MYQYVSHHNKYINNYIRKYFLLYYVIVKEKVLFHTKYNNKRKEMFYLTTHSQVNTASDIWQRTTQIARAKTRYRHMGYSFRVAARLILQDNTYHGLCYTSRGALAGTRISSDGPPWWIDPTTHRIMSGRSITGTLKKNYYCILH